MIMGSLAGWTLFLPQLQMPRKKKRPSGSRSGRNSPRSNKKRSTSNKREKSYKKRPTSNKRLGKRSWPESRGNGNQMKMDPSFVQQSVLGKRKGRPLSYPPGAPGRESGPLPIDDVDDVVNGKQQHGTMMGWMMGNADQLKKLRTGTKKTP